MALRGSSKWFSQQQEHRVARMYGGTVSPSSGAAQTDAGDVRVTSAMELIECKHTGSYGRPAASIRVNMDDLEKIADEAWAEGKSPVMALSIYRPDSVLANKDGFIDLTVRLASDDLRIREAAWRYEDLRG